MFAPAFLSEQVSYRFGSRSATDKVLSKEVSASLNCEKITFTNSH